MMGYFYFYEPDADKTSWIGFGKSLAMFQTFENLKNLQSIEVTLGEIAKARPEVYWYPGSGSDLTPLVLDVPGNRTGKRLFPLMGDGQQKPILLWLNDYNNKTLLSPAAGKLDFAYPDLMKKLKASYKIKDPIGTFVMVVQDRTDKRRYAIPTSVFNVWVSNESQSTKARPKDGDLYTVLFSFCESEFLFNNVFAHFRIPVRVTALIAQGGWSGQRSHFGLGKFDQYEDIPKLLIHNEDTIGKVESFIFDHNDIDHGQCLPAYEKRPSEIDWGVGNVTIFTRRIRREENLPVTTRKSTNPA